MYEDGIGREALCFDGERFQRRERELAAELPCRLYLDGELLSSFTCSPWQLSDLALGELRIRGLIRSASELSELIADEEKMEIHAKLRPRDRCGGEELSGEERMRRTEERILVPIRAVQKLSRIFNEASRKFHRTGGIHAAALADFEGLLLFREDVGRRNAMEKLLGACLKEEPDLSGKLILFSGRIAAEILEGASLIGPDRRLRPELHGGGACGEAGGDPDRLCEGRGIQYLYPSGENRGDHAPSRPELREEHWMGKAGTMLLPAWVEGERKGEGNPMHSPPLSGLLPENPIPFL